MSYWADPDGNGFSPKEKSENKASIYSGNGRKNSLGGKVLGLRSL
jgi:hypothetical protein